MADPLVPRVVRVRRRAQDAPGVWTLELETEASEVDAFTPGQFNMLTAFGVGEVPISVSGDPAAPERLAHTIRAVGPVSTALVRLETGQPLGLRGPFGRGWPMEAAEGRDLVIVAGGLGLAPLRPVLYEAVAQRPRFQRLVLLYGTRSPDDLLFRKEIEAWRGRLDMEVDVTVDHAPPSWRGHVGVVTGLIAGAAFDPSRTTAFVCGPEVMMRFTATALRDAGVEEDAIHVSMERNMKCAVGFCGHCQLGPEFVCRDGPVFRYDRVRDLFAVKEL